MVSATLRQAKSPRLVFAGEVLELLVRVALTPGGGKRGNFRYRSLGMRLLTCGALDLTKQ